MYWRSLCASVLLLVPAVLAADDVQAKLVSLAAAGNGLIHLNAQTYELLTTSNRNWSAAIQFTALDKRRRCEPCREFDPSWTAVAKAWAAVPKEHRDTHFFGTLDFDDGQTVFSQLGMTSAPVVYMYPPTQGPRQPASGKYNAVKYDFSNGFEAGPLAEQLSSHTPVPIPYRAPIDWARWATYIAGFLGSLSILRYIAPVLRSRWTWAVISILSSLIFTSGYMFTRIRNVPYSGANGNWIASGYQNQFGQEVQVIALVYGLLAFSFLMLTIIVPYQTSAARQRLQVYLWVGIIMIIYSVLVSIFKVKNRGYPFRLFL
ncbi:oligosaccharyl transferase subunit OST3/OST6 family [Armillaria gallica]|uniref:Oligosaccharyl transferase subunit OST3/OST6 family n=1 Tax=Armillaria gallica TaxID=47427 RepID=A0A2H3DNW6_ARMGA|nr:oligosaccharyl transferase subunit OST3/OST6 family [Armillaria gallica]